MRGWPLTLVLTSLPMPGEAYRPFESTDADVADAGELETELGYFTAARFDGENTYIVPKIVFNYGVTSRLELIGEFDVEKRPHDSAQIADAAVLLKGIARAGVLQDQPGLSIAWEAGLLAPSAAGDRSGLEGLGIVSGALGSTVYHLNAGGGLDPGSSQRFVVWGGIVEWPLRPNLKVVGELNGEKVEGEASESSLLIGLIWESPMSGDAFDGALRRGISDAASDWELTFGWTFSFPRR